MNALVVAILLVVLVTLLPNRREGFSEFFHKPRPTREVEIYDAAVDKSKYDEFEPKINRGSKTILHLLPHINLLSLYCNSVKMISESFPSKHSKYAKIFGMMTATRSQVYMMVMARTLPGP